MGLRPWPSPEVKQMSYQSGGAHWPIGRRLREHEPHSPFKRRTEDASCGAVQAAAIVAGAR